MNNVTPIREDIEISSPFLGLCNSKAYEERRRKRQLEETALRDEKRRIRDQYEERMRAREKEHNRFLLYESCAVGILFLVIFAQFICSLGG